MTVLATGFARSSALLPAQSAQGDERHRHQHEPAPGEPLAQDKAPGLEPEDDALVPGSTTQA